MAGRIVEEALKKVKSLTPSLDEIKVDRVVLGLGYTAVKLSSGHSGLCYTFQSEIVPHHCQVSRLAGTMAGKPALKIASMARSWDISESVVGVAALNALSQIAIESRSEAYTILNGDAIDHIKLTKKDVVAMVGHLAPMVKPVRARVKRLHILERSLTRRDGGILPDTACDQVLPRADVVIITGTTLANGTIDHLLELSKRAKEVAVVGPSAGILPEVLFEHGTTIVGGIKVTDTDKMMQIVSEGGGVPSLMEAIKFICFRPKTASTFRNKSSDEQA
jgi:hypothetical protein